MKNRETMMESIRKGMEAHDMKFRVEEHDDRSLLIAGFPVDNGPSVVVRFIVCDGDDAVAIRLYGLVRGVSDEKKTAVLKAVNEVNDTFRFIKYVMDSDGDVNIEADIPNSVPLDALGEVCFEMFIRVMSITDKAYPTLQRALWL